MELPTWWIIGVVVMVVLAILSFTCVFKKALKVRWQVQAALNTNVARVLAQQGQPQVIVIPQSYAGYEGAPGQGVAPVPVVYMHSGANPAMMGHVYPGTDPAATAHMYPGADPAAMGYSYPVAQAYPGANPIMYPEALMYPGAEPVTTVHGYPGVTMNPGNSPAMNPHAYPGAPMYPGTDPAMMSHTIPPTMATATWIPPTATTPYGEKRY